MQFEAHRLGGRCLIHWATVADAQVLFWVPRLENSDRVFAAAFGHHDVSGCVVECKSFVVTAGWDAGYWDAAIKISGGLLFAASGLAAESLRHEGRRAAEGVELMSGHLADSSGGSLRLNHWTTVPHGFRTPS